MLMLLRRLLSLEASGEREESRGSPPLAGDGVSSMRSSPCLEPPLAVW